MIEKTDYLYEGLVINKIKLIKKLDKRMNEQIVWLCECLNDGNIIEARSHSIRSGNVTSCGCEGRKNVSLAKKKYNRFDISGFFGIGYTTKGIEFYFDLDDYEKIRNHCWTISTTDGYLYTSVRIGMNKTKRIAMHVLIMGFPEEIIDHENRMKLDNRKNNLRFATSTENCRNTSIRKDNETGVIGVTKRIYNENRTSYVATIRVNGKQKHLFESKDLEKVIKIRLVAEKKYFGEYAPQKHLYSKYGIEE